MRIKVILLLVFTCLLTHAGLSQVTATTSEEALLKELVSSKAIKPELQNGHKLNEAASIQDGFNNNSFIQQVSTGAVPNQISLMQVGNFNNILMHQNGNNLTSEALQMGNLNFYKGSLEGQNVNSKVVQSGNNNYINQSISGQGLNYELMQLGNSNSLIQVETSNASPSYSVKQEGNNMSLKIEQGQWSVPVTVSHK